MSDGLLDILIHDEVQLIDWGESRAIGPWVKLRLADIEQLEKFRGLDTATAKKTGHIFNMTLSQGDILESQPACMQPFPDDKPSSVNKGPWGEQARALRLSSFFRTPDVWKAIGSPEGYANWIQKQPCIVCGNMDYAPDVIGGRCEAAHVRRAGKSGTGFKADYALVPLCHEHHATQHQHGETKAYRAHLIVKNGSEQMVTKDRAKNWFDKQRIEHIQRAGWETLRSELGYDSWTKVSPRELCDWAMDKGVHGCLPTEYRLAADQ